MNKLNGNVYHCQQIIDNKIYDTSKATVLHKGERWYFVTKKGRYFSAKESSICSEYTMLKLFSDIKLETEESIKDILARYDVEKYQTIYGKVEEA